MSSSNSNAQSGWAGAFVVCLALSLLAGRVAQSAQPTSRVPGIDALIVNASSIEIQAAATGALELEVNGGVTRHARIALGQSFEQHSLPPHYQFSTKLIRIDRGNATLEYTSQLYFPGRNPEQTTKTLVVRSYGRMQR